MAEHEEEPKREVSADEAHDGLEADEEGTAEGDAASSRRARSGEAQGRSSLLGELSERVGPAALQRRVLARKKGPATGKAGATDGEATLATTTATHDRLLHDIRLVEDGTRDRDSKKVDGHDPASGPAADLRVETALATEIAAADKARTAALRAQKGKRAGLIESYRIAVEALRAAYLESPLYSTDDLSVRGGAKWKKVAGKSELLASVSTSQLSKWQGASGYVKFVLPVSLSPHQAVVGTGPHIELAQGPVVAAGLLRFDFDKGGGKTVQELENVSGGFRPGPLRNATAAAAITAAGYTIAASAVHDVESGNYDGSHIAPQRK